MEDVMETKWTQGPWFANRHGDVETVDNEAVATTAGGKPTTEDLANAHLIASAPALYEALEAHRAWSYAEEHGLGSFNQRRALCAHAQSLTLRALASASGDPEPAYKGAVGMVVWPHVARTETEEAEGRALVVLCLEHEAAALSAAHGKEG